MSETAIVAIAVAFFGVIPPMITAMAAYRLARRNAEKTVQLHEENVHKIDANTILTEETKKEVEEIKKATDGMKDELIAVTRVSSEQRGIAQGIFEEKARIIVRAKKEDAAVIPASLIFDERFKEFIHTAPDAMLVVNQQGNIIMANHQVLSTFGYDPSDSLDGEMVEVLIPGRFRSAHRDHRGKYNAAPRVRPMGEPNMEILGRKKDGTEFSVEVRLSPIATGDGTFVMCSIRDVSKREEPKQAEINQEKVESNQKEETKTPGDPKVNG